MTLKTDIELMELADGEREDAELAGRLEADPDARTKVEALAEMGELVRGHLELSADDVHDAKFAAMWHRLDERLDASGAGAKGGVLARLMGWFDRYRSHVITGAVSAGAVAALTLFLRPSAPDAGMPGHEAGAIDVRPVALRAAPEIDSLDTPGGESTVINLDDEDGHTAVIWVTPEDTVEGI